VTKALTKTMSHIVVMRRILVHEMFKLRRILNDDIDNSSKPDAP